jgi:3-methyladenine DNA glycosylase AlkD
MQASEVKTALKKLANPKQAQLLQGYFKTGKGQYGEGDIFLGVMVPKQRQVAKDFSQLPLKEIATLLKSPVHEHRFTALAVLVGKFKKLQRNKSILEIQQKQIVDFYLKNAKHINNWDLVDSSAPYILGHYLLGQYLTTNAGRQSAVKKITAMAKSKNLWERRMAIVATFPFIQQKIFQPSLDLAVQLIRDPHDLIHKATGWMLREVGKKDEKILLKFLNQYAQTLHRTCLRYTVERLGKKRKRVYFKK